MNNFMMFVGVGLAAGCLVSSPVWAQENAGRFYGTLDYYLPGDVGDEMESDMTHVTPDSTSMSQDIMGGVGVRIGYLKHMASHFSIGGSGGFILGPRIETEMMDPNNGSTVGALREKVQNWYVRLMAECVGHKPVAQRMTVNLGFGLGLAFAKTEQAWRGTDDYATDESFMDHAIGLTWEISPSVDINFEKVALSFGLRYTGLPRIKETDEISKVEWAPFGFFAGLKF